MATQNLLGQRLDDLDLGHAVEKRPKPPVPVATGIAFHLKAKDGSDVPLSYWDVWYALLAEEDFAGDLDQLGRELRERRRGSSYSDDATQKLSHLRDLQQRLAEADLSLEPDLLELLVFEDHGFTYDNTDGFFASLSRTDGDLCLAYLRERIQTLMALDLDYQAAEALTLIGQVAAEQKRFDLFEALATEMGSRAWKRIILMADAAVRSGQRDLADRVFQAALATGDGEDVGHSDFLAKKHNQLLHGTWNPDPRK